MFGESLAFSLSIYLFILIPRLEGVVWRVLAKKYSSLLSHPPRASLKILVRTWLKQIFLHQCFRDQLHKGPGGRSAEGRRGSRVLQGQVQSGWFPPSREPLVIPEMPWEPQPLLLITETMVIIKGNFHAWVPKAACLHSLVEKRRASKVR